VEEPVFRHQGISARTKAVPAAPPAALAGVLQLPSSSRRAATASVRSGDATGRWAPLSQVREWIDFYRQSGAQRHRPVRVSSTISRVFTFVHCAETDEEAMRNGRRPRLRLVHQNGVHVFEAREGS